MVVELQPNGMYAEEWKPFSKEKSELVFEGLVPLMYQENGPANLRMLYSSLHQIQYLECLLLDYKFERPLQFLVSVT